MSGLRAVSGREFSKWFSGVQSRSVRLVCGRPSAGQSRSPGFKVDQPLSVGENPFGTAGAISTACGFLPRQIAPLPFNKNYFDAGCTRSPQSMGKQDRFFEEKGSGFLNPTSNYRSRPLPSRLKTILAQASTATCGQRRPKIFEPTS